MLLFLYILTYIMIWPAVLLKKYIRSEDGILAQLANHLQYWHVIWAMAHILAITHLTQITPFLWPGKTVEVGLMHLDTAPKRESGRRLEEHQETCGQGEATETAEWCCTDHIPQVVRDQQLDPCRKSSSLEAQEVNLVTELPIQQTWLIQAWAEME